jgi:hypothetical protein
MWQDDAGVDHDAFVVVGVDIGGNPFGFFAGTGDSVRVQLIGHDDGATEAASWTLQEYLLHYFAHCPWFQRPR